MKSHIALLALLGVLAAGCGDEASIVANQPDVAEPDAADAALPDSAPVDVNEEDAASRIWRPLIAPRPAKKVKVALERAAPLPMTAYPVYAHCTWATRYARKHAMKHVLKGLPAPLLAPEGMGSMSVYRTPPTCAFPAWIQAPAQGRVRTRVYFTQTA